MRIMGEREFAAFLEDRNRARRDPVLGEQVRAIIDDVKTRGDEALVEYGRRFDGVSAGCGRLEVTPGEFEEAYGRVDGFTVEAIRFAARRVWSYNEQMTACSTRLVPVDGGILGRIYRPVDSAGLYIPGGRKPYISTVIMTAVPARVAGVRTVIACTPPRRDGSVDPHILVACREAGVDRLFKVGGAQAIAAMAYGTETIPRVDKVAGPGNRFVTAAKQAVYGDTGVDSLAGPSEVAILAGELAGEEADAGWIAADLLAQAEHGPDSLAVLFSTSGELVDEVARRVAAGGDAVVGGGEGGLEAGENSPGPLALGVCCTSVHGALDLINRLAPEHLQIMVGNPLEVIPLVRAAGAILVGRYSPAALGDYAAGPSHVLPTGGAARFSSGLTADDFMVSSSLVWESRTGISRTGEMAARLAELEGFTWHARALRAREGGVETGWSK